MAKDAAYYREYYRRNRERILAQRKTNPKVREKRKDWARKSRKEKQDYVRHLKSSTPCADCSQFYPPAVMEFDHLDPSLKFKGVNRMLGQGLKKLQDEINKCELVCANCHRIRHLDDEQQRAAWRNATSSETTP